MLSSGMLCHVTLVRTDIFEEHVTSIIRITRIGKLETILAVTSNQSMLANSCHPGDGGDMFLLNVGFSTSHTCNMPENSIHHSHSQENLKSYIE
jgi:hypothetical protein